MDDDVLMTIIAEAIGEGSEGMRRVGETILNRAAIRGLTPEQVVRQPAQYTGYSAPGPAAVAAQQDPASLAAARAAWELARQPGDPTDGADHYHADYVNPYWADSMPSTGAYGAHKFYASQAVPAEALAALLTRKAPIPFDPPARRSDVPSDLIAQSFADNAETQARRGVLNLLGPSVGDATPRMSRKGNAIDPASIVFSDQMTTALDPAGGGGPIAIAAKAAADMLIKHNTNQKTAVDERNKTISASFAARPTISASDMARGNSGASKINNTPTVGTGPPPAIAQMFGPRIPGPSGHTNDNKSQERLTPTTGLNPKAPGPALFGSLDPRFFAVPPTPRPASDARIARAPKPQAKTVTENIPNPAWAEWSKMDSPGKMPSWDQFSAAFVPPKLEPPKTLAVTRKVPVARTSPIEPPTIHPAAPRPAARPARAAAPQPRPQPRPEPKTVVQQYRDRGLSPSEAYDTANRAASERAIANAAPKYRDPGALWRRL